MASAVFPGELPRNPHLRPAPNGCRWSASWRPPCWRAPRCTGGWPPWSPGATFWWFHRLVMTHIAMENDTFIDDLPSYKPLFYSGFSMAMLNNQMVHHDSLWFMVIKNSDFLVISHHDSLGFMVIEIVIFWWFYIMIHWGSWWLKRWFSGDFMMIDWGSWWFHPDFLWMEVTGTWLLFFHSVGNFIIPVDYFS